MCFAAPDRQQAAKTAHMRRLEPELLPWQTGEQIGAFIQQRIMAADHADGLVDFRQRPQQLDVYHRAGFETFTILGHDQPAVGFQEAADQTGTSLERNGRILAAAGCSQADPDIFLVFE